MQIHNLLTCLFSQMLLLFQPRCAREMVRLNRVLCFWFSAQTTSGDGAASLAASNALLSHVN